MQRFAKDELDLVDTMLTEGVDAVRAVVSLGVHKALSGCRVDSKGKQYSVQAPSKKKKNGQQQQPGADDAKSAAQVVSA